MTGNSDAGLVAYATLLAIHRVAVDPVQLRHELGHDRPVTADELLRLAKHQPDVRAKAERADGIGWPDCRCRRLPTDLRAGS